jgi:serine/threonine protein kinase
MIPRNSSPDLDTPQRRTWIATCWSDMRRRQAAGLPFAAEDYLTESASEADRVVDLVYGEYMLRREAGQIVNYATFLKRFPQQADALQRQFALEDALSSARPGADETTVLPPQPTTLNKAPERIGKYLIVASLASGGQAHVYRALHPDLKIEVAIKVPRRRANAPSPPPDELRAEAQTLAALSHPNLARVFDVGEHDGLPYLVSEYIRGRTLEQFALDQSPSPREAALLVAKTARALAVAHSSGVVHLDIKPRNILIDERGEPRLIDFGLAIRRHADDETAAESGSLRGTLCFMSPEQAQGNQTAIGPRSDIFALGGVLFYLLTRQCPYDSDNFTELLEQARQGNWRRELLVDKQVPSSLQRICQRAMDVALERRFATADEFAAELERYALPPLWRRRNLLAAGCLGVAALLLTAPFLRSSGAPTNDAAPAAPAGNHPLLSIQVWDDGRYLRLVDATPLKNGDRLRLTAKLPADCHAAMFLLTSEGQWKLLSQAEPASTLQFPADDDQAVPLNGPPGTEVVIVCGQHGSPISLADLLNVTGTTTSQPWPPLPDMTVMLADVSDVHVLQQGRDFGPPANTPNPERLVRERLHALRDALAKRFDCFEAVAFFHGE